MKFLYINHIICEIKHSHIICGINDRLDTEKYQCKEEQRKGYQQISC